MCSLGWQWRSQPLKYWHYPYVPCAEKYPCLITAVAGCSRSSDWSRGSQRYLSCVVSWSNTWWCAVTQQRWSQGIEKNHDHSGRERYCPYKACMIPIATAFSINGISHLHGGKLPFLSFSCRQLKYL